MKTAIDKSVALLQAKDNSTCVLGLQG